MQLMNMILVAFAAILIPTEACKCIVGQRPFDQTTNSCCNVVGGKMTGNDCSTPDKAREFGKCCASGESHSDC